MLIELTAQFDLRFAALTRGPHGSLLIAGSERGRCPAPPTTVVDTVGAGDAFTATLVIGFSREAGPLDAINRHANAVASFVCSQSGATPPFCPTIYANTHQANEDELTPLAVALRRIARAAPLRQHPSRCRHLPRAVPSAVPFHAGDATG